MCKKWKMDGIHFYFGIENLFKDQNLNLKLNRKFKELYFHNILQKMLLQDVRVVQFVFMILEFKKNQSKALSHNLNHIELLLLG